jgi:hypothetical protein
MEGDPLVEIVPMPDRPIADDSTARKQARRRLLAASAMIAFLFAAYQKQSVSEAYRTYGPDCPGATIRSDGLGYYAWLRSALFDGDLSFDNEFDEHQAYHDAVPPREIRTPLGRRTNPYSAGPACVWALPVAATHGLMVATGGFGRWTVDGYSLPYQMAVALTALVLAVATLWLLFQICQLFAEPLAAANAAIIVYFSSTLLYYATVEPTMGHLYGAFAFALFLRYWLRSFGSDRAIRWFTLGLLLGFVALMRWQMVTYVMLPVGEMAWCSWRDLSRRKPIPAIRNLALLGLGAGIAFSPQMIGWKIVYGDWLVITHTLAKNWWSPNVSPVLFSQDHGFFFWTPITFICFCGLLAILASRSATAEHRVTAVLFVLGLGVQINLIGVVSGTGVFLGLAFGLRYLTETCITLAPGLAFLLSRYPIAKPWLLRLGFLLMFWNFVLITAFRTPASRYEPWDGPVSLLRIMIG